MNIDKLQRKLIAAARTERPSDGVPFAFGNRITAALRTVSDTDRWAPWAGALWRAAAPCAGAALLLALWTVLVPPPTPAEVDLAAQFEEVLLAEESSFSLPPVTEAE